MGKEMIVMVAAIITGSSGKGADAAVELAVRIFDAVDKKFPTCPRCDSSMIEGAPCTVCASRGYESEEPNLQAQP